MDQIKIDDFARDHPAESFPKYRKLSAEDTSWIRNAIVRKLGLVPEVTPLELVKTVSDMSTEVPNVNAEDQNLDLRRLLTKIGVTPKQKVLINWHRFDDVDEMSLDELSKYLLDLWYPRAEAIDIFDDSLSWILSIDYSGTMSLLKL